MMKIGRWVVCLALVLSSAAAHASPDRVRFLEGAKAAAQMSEAELAEEVKGYLPANPIDVGAILSGPPAVGTNEDAADIDLARRYVEIGGEAGWKRALADDASVYDRFDEALGRPIDRKTLPRLVRLLNRVSADVLALTAAAKERFPRPRPYQRFALKRVCGFAAPPKPEESPTKGTSYPSGHAALGWGIALTMSEAAPLRAVFLVARANSYGESRVICGVHYPSDIEASLRVGGTVFDKLLELPEFRRDLRCVKTELEAVAGGQRSEDLPACQ